MILGVVVQSLIELQLLHILLVLDLHVLWDVLLLGLLSAVCGRRILALIARLVSCFDHLAHVDHTAESGSSL